MPVAAGRCAGSTSVARDRKSRAPREFRYNSFGKIVRIKIAPVAQLDRVTGFEPVGREFESLQARQIKKAGFIPAFFICCDWGQDESFCSTELPGAIQNFERSEKAL